jgi:hypothetical protein
MTRTIYALNYARLKALGLLAVPDSRGRKVACLQCGKVQSAEDAWEEPDTLVGLPTLLRRVVDREAA